MPDTRTPRAGPRRRRTAAPADTVAIGVETDDHAPSELEAAVLAAASGYRFGEIEVPATIARALERMGFTVPTEVQARAIPPLRRGEDLIGQAQTGTGKTAAFGIPIVEKIEPSSAHVQALVLTPTRELCVQVTEEIARIGQFRGVRTVAIYGGSSMDKQVEALKRGAQVVIGTPGRVLDLIRRGELRLDRVNTVILDEADRMLDMGFIVDVETILSRCPRQRQTALFSATMPYAILRICDRFMKHDPAHVTVRPDLRTVETVRQLVYFVAEQDKVKALIELTDQFGFDRLLVFRHTQIGVDRLAVTLARRGKNVAGLHGGLSQRERDRTLAAFRAGKIQFLIATNVASRGLDITDLPYVVSYDIPEDADTYVHRIGRTGRAGKEGTAITFVGEWDLDAWESIRAEVGATVEEGELDLYSAGGG
ncbi:MAG: DEAD/DEAH box helicase [Chloroflexi bacterium]|nr:DEAD/DEAH box helicase [Chloroflexota bacterium]MBA3739560.1 DEAD/DEAH box helicase [Chloroflexota bacterium]